MTVIANQIRITDVFTLGRFISYKTNSHAIDVAVLLHKSEKFPSEPWRGSIPLNDRMSDSK